MRQSTGKGEKMMRGVARARVKFTVVGGVSFPVDMLRYDSCWPAYEQESRKIEAMIRHEHRGQQEVTLLGLHNPTIARWDSFVWRVKEDSIEQL